MPKHHHHEKRSKKNMDEEMEEDEEDYDLPMLNPAITMGDDQTVACFGPRKCGKTTCIYWILLIKAFLAGIVMCPTPECYVTYEKFIPSAYIYNEFNRDKVQEIMSQQAVLADKIRHQVAKEEARLLEGQRIKNEELLKTMKQNLKQLAIERKWTEEEIAIQFERLCHEYEFLIEQGEAEIVRELNDLNNKIRKQHAKFMIWDDLASDNSLHDLIVKYIFNNGRHYLLFLMAAIQDVLELPPRSRGGLDWSLIFFESRKDVIKILYDKYATIVGSEKKLKKLLHYAQSKNCCLAVRKNHSNPTFSNSVFLFPRKPIPLAPQKLGCDLYWQAGGMWLDAQKFRKYKARPLAIMAGPGHKNKKLDLPVSDSEKDSDPKKKDKGKKKKKVEKKLLLDDSSMQLRKKKKKEKASRR
jgi:hypothetical protein